MVQLRGAVFIYTYEILLDETNQKGLIVKEKLLKSSNGRIKGNHIAIRKNISTTTEKTCTVAEKLGHHYTTVGNILDVSVSWNRKQEQQARFYSYQRLVGLVQLIKAN